MRILVLTPTFLPVIGGMELVIYEIFRRLRPDHEILILTPYLPQHLIDHYAAKPGDYPFDFRVEHYNDRWTMMKIRGHKVLRGFIPPFSFSAVRSLHAHVVAFKPDVINVHFTMPTGLAGYIADRVWGIPAVLTLNGRDVPGPGVPWFWKHWHRIIRRGYSDITYGSDYCRDVIFGTQGSGTVTWNGVDFKRITNGNPSPVIDRYHLSGRKVLFSLQRLSREKGIDLVLRAFSGVVRKEPDAVLLLGGTGPEERYLKQLSRELGLGEHIHFCGFIGEDDLKNHFAAADVFVFNTHFETFGIVLAQAMANAVPIVSVHNTAVDGVVRDGGILVPPCDPGAFCDAVLDLLHDSAKRSQLGNRGRIRAAELFDWDIVCRKYELVFENARKNRQ